MTYKSVFYNVSDRTLQLLCDAIGIKLNEIARKDEIKTKIKNGFYIINLDDGDDGDGSGNGTHWVCFYVVNKFALYFDSFGLPPPDDIRHYLRTKTIVAYPNQIQDIRSEACGYFCIDFIHYFNQFFPSSLNSREKIGLHMSRYGRDYDYNNRANNEQVLKTRIRVILQGA